MENRKIRVAITHGDTNGVGYELIFKTFAEPEMLELCTPIVYGSPKIAAYHRKALDRETLGVPVVAVGVPLVVYASTIAADALCALGEGEVEEERIAACVERVVSEKLGEMIVTPREVDALVERMACVLADGINKALHPRLSRDEIAQMMAQ